MATAAVEGMIEGGELQALVSFLAYQLDARCGLLAVMDEASPVARTAAVFGLNRRVVGVEIPRGEGLVGQVLSGERAIAEPAGLGASLGETSGWGPATYTVAAPLGSPVAGAFCLGFDRRPAGDESNLLAVISFQAALCERCLRVPENYERLIELARQWGSPNGHVEIARQADEVAPEAAPRAQAVVAGREAGAGPSEARRIGMRRHQPAADQPTGPQLKIGALGATTVESSEAMVEPSWLFQRPCQLLKYLVCRRDEVVTADECVEALWPGSGMGGRNSVRHAVFSLREMLEPKRGRRKGSSFVVTLGGGYTLNRHRVQLDVDEFERLLRPDADGAEPSVEALESAMRVYRGDLFSDEPYAEWAFPERERLRDLADLALRRLAAVKLESEDLRAAEQALLRLAAMWPLDQKTHRAQIAICLERGHWSQARRWYAAFRHRLERDLGVEPDFTLADLAAAPAEVVMEAL